MKHLIAVIALLLSVGGLVADPRFPNGEPIRAPRDIYLSVTFTGTLRQDGAGWFVHRGEEKMGDDLRLMVRPQDAEKVLSLKDKHIWVEARVLPEPSPGFQVEKIEEVKP